MEIRFCNRITGLNLHDRMRSSSIRERLRVETLLLQNERSQLSWFGHLTRMSPGWFPLDLYQTHDLKVNPGFYSWLGMPENLPGGAGICGQWLIYHSKRELLGDPPVGSEICVTRLYTIYMWTPSHHTHTWFFPKLMPQGFKHSIV